MPATMPSPDPAPVTYPAPPAPRPATVPGPTLAGRDGLVLPAPIYRPDLGTIEF